MADTADTLLIAARGGGSLSAPGRGQSARMLQANMLCPPTASPRCCRDVGLAAPPQSFRPPT
jgi:hypothetical protein